MRGSATRWQRQNLRLWLHPGRSSTSRRVELVVHDRQGIVRVAERQRCTGHLPVLRNNDALVRCVECIDAELRTWRQQFPPATIERTLKERSQMVVRRLEPCRPGLNAVALNCAYWIAAASRIADDPIRAPKSGEGRSVHIVSAVLVNERGDAYPLPRSTPDSAGR